jgi:hypothetical protein
MSHTVVQASHQFCFVIFSLCLKVGFPLSLFLSQTWDMQFLIIWSFWIMDTEKFSVCLKIIYFCKNMHHHWLWRFDLSRWLQSMNQLHQQCAKSMSQLLLRQRGGLSAITWGAVQLNTQIILFVLQLGWFLQPLQVHCIATVYWLLEIPLLQYALQHTPVLVRALQILFLGSLSQNIC